MIEPERPFYCTWCGEQVDEIKEPEYPGENVVGKCDDDGIVYVTTDPDEAG